jgi:hypothetical protein
MWSGVQLRKDNNAGRRRGIGEMQVNHEGAGYNRVRKRFRGGNMDSWKKAVMAASIGAATVLFLKKRYAGGVLAGGVALAVLAAEYPEKFEQVRESLPSYFDRGMQVMEMAAKAGKRITEAAGPSAMDAWEEL